MKPEGMHDFLLHPKTPLYQKATCGWDNLADVVLHESLPLFNLPPEP